MEIAFITDLHIPKIYKTARGVDTKTNLNLVLEDLKEQKIQYIIIGGDVSFSEPDSEANKYLKKEVDKLRIPYLIIAGNHDDPTQLKETFDFPEGLDELYYVKQLDDHFIMCLDSSTGKISNKQLEWVESTLSKNKSLRTIFIHHPIVKGGVVYMDNNHALSNMHEIQNILFSFERNFVVFSGHYHTEKTIVYRNIIQHITPSIFIQIEQNASEFEIDHLVPGYRIVQLRKDRIMSYVRYIS